MQNVIPILGQTYYNLTLRGVVANVMNCDIVVSEFELQSCYYVNFRTNTRVKNVKFLISSLNHHCSTRIALSLNNP